MTGPRYAELVAASNFSFLRGASHPDELVMTAAALGHAAIAVVDRNTLAGVVRSHMAAKQVGIRLVVGARLVLGEADGPGGPEIVCLPTDRASYGRLSRLISTGQRRAPKGRCHLDLADVEAMGEGQVLILLPPPGWQPRRVDPAFDAWTARLAATFRGRAYLAAALLRRGDDAERLVALGAAARRLDVPLVAVGDVRMHAPERRPLMDVLTAIRHGCTLADAGRRLDPNAERHLKSPAEMARLFAAAPDALARTVEIAERCTFSLDTLRYDYPADAVEGGRTPQQELEHRTRAGARERYPGGVPPKVAGQIDHELKLIGELGYAPYFLTVDDIVRFARGRGILAQGRGSAANSTVCYCLGVTAVDPDRMDLLFERFVSAARNEPPDIDVDFEHERREEVIQYVYARWGRERAGLAATVIRYRSRSAVREVGKVMGLSADTVAALSGTVWGWGGKGVDPAHVREAGLDPGDPVLALTLDLARELQGFPRHLSQHVGGFIVTHGRLDEVVPVGNAAMADRTVVEWDKDDLDALGILKIDLLALGMLTCLRKAMALLPPVDGRPFAMADIPEDDPETFAMLSRADSIGVFQVESRAQMSMLPRLKPKEFYDLVIQVAIVRPGPIQGDMVHPYLRRREGREKVDYPSPELREVLMRTKGVPLFQEQAMRIAMVAGGFTPGEADQLRRAMAAFRRAGTVAAFRDKLLNGMIARGYDRAFAERCFRQIEGFGEYGFPESHAASFALLAWASAWLKCRHPAVFACALLNSQPMGFYAPAQIVRDAREHGVTVRPPDVGISLWDCTLEESGADGTGGPALRLGLRQIRGFTEADALRLIAARGAGPFRGVADLARRTGLSRAALARLAHADAWRSLGLDRRAAQWAVEGLADRAGLADLPLFAGREEPEEAAVPLPAMSAGEHVVQDYAALRLSLKAHPVSFLRPALDARALVPCAALAGVADGTVLAVAGLVLIRQRPGSAHGVVFLTIEDETGIANLVVWQNVFTRFRRIVMGARLLMAAGRVQKQSGVIHLVVQHLADEGPLLDALSIPGTGRPARVMPSSRDFH